MMYDKQHAFSCVEEAGLCFRHFDETFSYLEAIIKSNLNRPANPNNPKILS